MTLYDREYVNVRHELEGLLRYTIFIESLFLMQYPTAPMRLFELKVEDELNTRFQNHHPRPRPPPRRRRRRHHHHHHHHHHNHHHHHHHHRREINGCH